MKRTAYLCLSLTSRTSLDSLIHPTDELEGIQLSRLDVQLLEHRQVCLVLQAYVRAQLVSATSRRLDVAVLSEALRL